jgi:hypothetical protein
MRQIIIDFISGVSLRDGILIPPYWNDAFPKESLTLAFAVLATVVYLFIRLRNTHDFKAPFVGYRSFWEPTFILRLRFVQGARPIVMEGYRKVTRPSGF